MSMAYKLKTISLLNYIKMVLFVYFKINIMSYIL